MDKKLIVYYYLYVFIIIAYIYLFIQNLHFIICSLHCLQEQLCKIITARPYLDYIENTTWVNSGGSYEVVHFSCYCPSYFAIDSLIIRIALYNTACHKLGHQVMVS